MPTNKDALIRVKILDELLSDNGHRYTWNELFDAVNERLRQLDKTAVTRRCIEKDVAFIESYLDGDIKKERIGAETEFGGYTENTRIFYEDPGFSIFRKKMSKEEAYLLRQILSTIGQFDGMPDFSAIANLANSHIAKMFDEGREEQKIISFDRSPLETNRKIFAKLFLAISRQQVVRLSYHIYENVEDIKHILLHPYFLKEYNRRWYVYGVADCDQYHLCFALDRIDDVESLIANKYIKYQGQFDEWFDDIIGVTKGKDKTIHKILFWADEKEKYFIITKPLHGSQRLIRNDEKVRSKYPQLKDGKFFTIECMNNYELIRELCSYGNGLIVLEPKTIKDDVLRRTQDMLNAYKSLEA